MYINFFSWVKVPAPESDETPIPVFGREITFGKQYSLVNIAFNPEVLNKYGKKSCKHQETDMLINLAFIYLEDQNKHTKIKRSNFEILKNMNNKGDLQKCIQEITSKNDDSDGTNLNGMSDLELAKAALESTTGSNLPDNVLNKLININLVNPNSKSKNNKKQDKAFFVEENLSGFDTSKAETEPKNSKLILEILSYEEKITIDKEDSKKFYLEFRISLPKINSINECDLNVDCNSLILNANKEFYSELEISLSKFKDKYEIKVDDIEAKFIKKTSLLRIKIPMILI